MTAAEELRRKVVNLLAPRYISAGIDVYDLMDRVVALFNPRKDIKPAKEASAQRKPIQYRQYRKDVSTGSIVEAIRDGLTARQTAKKLHCSEGLIYNRLESGQYRYRDLRKSAAEGRGKPSRKNPLPTKELAEEIRTGHRRTTVSADKNGVVLTNTEMADLASHNR